ncbi:hypothetical protein LXL04_007638 [Taraxacum kok-saghyz]
MPNDISRWFMVVSHDFCLKYPSTIIFLLAYNQEWAFDQTRAGVDESIPSASYIATVKEEEGGSCRLRFVSPKEEEARVIVMNLVNKEEFCYFSLAKRYTEKENKYPSNTGSKENNGSKRNNIKRD